MEPLCPSLPGEYDKYTYQYEWTKASLGLGQVRNVVEIKGERYGRPEQSRTVRKP
jgi:hypothetical protein